MPGQPKTRERMKEAVAVAEDAAKQLDTVRIALIRKGLDPTDYGIGAPLSEPPTLTAYSPTLPGAITRLSGLGQSIEEIRVTLGFTAKQQADWDGLYVDFSAALARVRAREEAFWLSQARQAAKTGDRPGFTAITALIQKRFTDTASAANAEAMVHVHSDVRRAQPEPDEA